MTARALFFFKPLSISPNRADFLSNLFSEAKRA